MTLMRGDEPAIGAEMGDRKGRKKSKKPKNPITFKTGRNDETADTLEHCCEASLE
jgi:hypothetical protein